MIAYFYKKINKFLYMKKISYSIASQSFTDAFFESFKTVPIIEKNEISEKAVTLFEKVTGFEEKNHPKIFKTAKFLFIPAVCTPLLLVGSPQVLIVAAICELTFCLILAARAIGVFPKAVSSYRKDLRVFTDWSQKSVNNQKVFQAIMNAHHLKSKYLDLSGICFDSLPTECFKYLQHLEKVTIHRDLISHSAPFFELPFLKELKFNVPLSIPAKEKEIESIREWLKDDGAKGNKKKALKKMLKAYQTNRPYLDLSGLGLNHLPCALDLYCSHIKLIRLNSNLFESIPIQARQLPNLDQIILDKNDKAASVENMQKYVLEDSQAQYIFNILSDQPFITVFNPKFLKDYVRNSISKEDLETREKVVKNFIETLFSADKTLDLSSFNIPIPHVPPLFVHSELETVHLGASRYTSFADLFFYLPNLKKLSFSTDNEEVVTLEKEEIEEIKKWIQEERYLCSKEKELVLERLVNGTISTSNEELDLSDFGMSSLPTSFFKHLSHIKTLNLYFNRLTEFPSGLSELKIENLNLGYNPINKWPFELEKLSSLKTLVLSNIGLAALPQEIGNLTNLTSLDLRDNKLVSLPAEIGNLANLTELCLNRNQLKGLPSECKGLTELQYLYLIENPLEKFPSEIQYFHKLKNLSVSSSGLKELPDYFQTLSDFKKLKYLDLSYNFLEKIPFLGDIKQLDNLSVYSNRLLLSPENLETFFSLDSEVFNRIVIIPIPYSFVDCSLNKIKALMEGIRKWLKDDQATGKKFEALSNILIAYQNGDETLDLRHFGLSELPAILSDYFSNFSCIKTEGNQFAKIARKQEDGKWIEDVRFFSEHQSNIESEFDIDFEEELNNENKLYSTDTESSNGTK